MRSTTTLTIFFALTAAVHAEDNGPAEKSQAVRDATLIAEWLHGGDAGSTFGKDRFGDRSYLTKGKDIVFYSDVPGLTAPKWSRRVTFEGMQSRSQALKAGHDLAPLVLITLSTRERPEEGVLKSAREVWVKVENPRYYYVEVGIGNLAWHWIRFEFYDEDGKTRARITSSAIS